jgi:hypothetical protein
MLKQGAVGISDDGEVIWRVSCPAPQGMSKDDKSKLVIALVTELIEMLPTVRKTILEPTLVGLGLSRDLCELVHDQLEDSGPVQTLSSALNQPYANFRDMLVGLRGLVRTCLYLPGWQSGGRDNSEAQFDCIAKLQADVERRLALTGDDIPPAVLSEIVSRPYELRSRLLGFLAVQALYPVHEADPEYASLCCLGEGLYPESWPHEISTLRKVARDLLEEGLVVSGLLCETPPAFSGELLLNSTLHLSPSALKAAVQTLQDDGLASADLGALRRRLKFL